MDDYDISQTDPYSLADLMATGDDLETTWLPQDMKDIMQHQLDSPISDDNPPMSFRDLLLNDNPLVELLRKAKDFAKAHACHPDGPLPREIASVMYHAAILAAMLKCNERITSLSDQELIEGLEWLINCEWVDRQIRRLFVEGLSLLNA